MEKTLKVEHTRENSNNVLSSEVVLDSKTVGILNFLFDHKTRILRSKLTVLAAEHRKYGIATMLWSEVIKEYSPVLISVSTVSAGGEKLVLSLKKQHPNIEWDLW
jgi:hypothetical protein